MKLANYPSAAISNTRSFVAVIALFMGLLLPAVASRASFGIMPMEMAQQMPVNAHRVTNDIEVYNGSETPLHISSTVVDWDLTRDGEYTYSEPGSEPASCAPWIQLNPAQFVLSPKKSLRVRYTISAPTPFFEERRAMIFFQSRAVPLKGGNSLGVMVSMRMGHKVLLSPPGVISRAAKIAETSVQSAEKTTVTVSVSNTGAASFRAKGTIEVRGEDGQLVAQGDLSSAQVLPGRVRDLRYTLNHPLPPGKYALRAVVDYGARDLLGGQFKASVAPVSVAPVSVAPVAVAPVAMASPPTQ